MSLVRLPEFWCPICGRNVDLDEVYLASNRMHFHYSGDGSRHELEEKTLEY